MIYRPYSTSYYPNSPPPIPFAETKQEEKEEPEKEEEDRQFFEILGIKLYFDDILIICLLFFLYQEGVKDQYLFISLILLLLS